MKRLIVVMIGVLLVLSNLAVERILGDSTYIPASYSPGPLGAGQQRLRLFPHGSAEKVIPLPFRFSVYRVGPYGRAIYATVGPESMQAVDQPPKRGVFKVEFNPTRAAMIPGTEGLFAIDLSISKDKVLVSGRNSNGHSEACGVFEIALKDSSIRQILSWDCQGNDGKKHFTRFSSDGLWGLTISRGQLAVIELKEGHTYFAGENLSDAVWSPDGKWIAAREATFDGRIVIFEASTLTPIRVLFWADLVWSPDSRFLLSRRPACSSDTSTLEKVDIETDMRTSIGAANCTTEELPLWLSGDLVR